MTKYGILVGVLALAGISASVANAADCAYCNKSIEGKPYTLKDGAKTEVFKCVYCAVAQAMEEHKGDVTIGCPSEKPNQPVIIKRVGGAWKQFPATATFVSASHLKHKMCGEQFRAFTTKAAAQAYLKSGNADATLTLAQLIEKAK